MNYIYQKEQNNGENANPEPEQSMRLGAKELKNMIEKFNIIKKSMRARQFQVLIMSVITANYFWAICHESNVV